MPSVVFLFATTHDTIKAERLARERGFDAAVVPQPPGRTGRCGVALEVEAARGAALNDIFDAAGLRDFEYFER